MEEEVMTVSVAPTPHHRRQAAGRESGGGPLGWWAVRLAFVFGTAFWASVAAIAVSYAVGVESAVEDTLGGAFLGVAATVGFFGSLVAFLTALTAHVREERTAWLWLPLCLFPAILLFVVLGEAFWWE